ncbi:MAG TPA: hypothetical protein VMB79_11910 [Jatrophihabitans sp.]|nr:hypothetical protein [Jatrophihabitans sp.]
MKVPRLAALAGLLALGASSVAAVTTAVTASADIPWYGPKTVVMTTCSLPANTSNTSAPPVITASGDSGGSIYGFASCRTNVPGAIYFFMTKGGHSIHQATPYRGSLEVAATDGTGAVYLVYSVRTSTDTSVYIARRSAQGAYSPSALLTHTVGRFRPSVSLAAANGKWWTVWSEAPGPNRPLFERRTLLGTRARHAITLTSPRSESWDWTPGLAVEGDLARLAWITGGDLGNRWAFTQSRPDGVWKTGVLMSPPGAILRIPPKLVMTGGHVYVAWWYGGGPVYGDDSSGALRFRKLAAPAFTPYLAVSGGVSTIAENATGDVVASPYLHIDELRSGVWSSANWPTVDSMDSVLSNGGRATFVMHKSTSPVVYLLTETS